MFSLGSRPKSTPGTPPPRSPGPAPHIKMHEKSAPQTNFKAISWHPQKTRQTAFSQVSRPSEFPPRPAGYAYLKAVWLEIFGPGFFGFPLVWAAPGGRETHQNRWGASPPPFFEGFPCRQGPPRPPKSTISGRSKIHNHRNCIRIGLRC